MKGVFPIVGVGASAGGLEAVSRLLHAMPPDAGLAFVVVQHLDPDRESLLPQLLQRSTSMPVAQAKNGAVVVPNRVYVIPPGVHMCIKDGRLALKPRPAGIHALAVDCFLNSLAEERGSRAIAVILSGTASDGALGVRAVKAGGGLVFAQDEASAGHSGMPLSAEATGAVDFVLSPEAIAAELARVVKHPLLKPAAGELFEEPAVLTRIFSTLRRTTGVDFSLYKASTVKRRLLRRLMVHKLERLDKYADLLERSADEARALHDDLLIHVTYFFREPKTLELLRQKALPRIVRALPPDAPIRVWVPGCSTGEEAYTLAVLLLDFLSERDRVNPIQIFATDISEAALERARQGRYAEDIQNHVPPRLLRRYFKKVESGYEIVKRVRDLCVFARQDLTRDPPFGHLDLISCCNVLIYLTPAAQKNVLPMFHYALRPDGALVLGKSESVGEYDDLFKQAHKSARIYFKLPAPSRMPVAFKAQHAASQARAAGKDRAPGGASGWPETDVQRVAERILLSTFAPAGLIADGELNILHFRGAVNRFLEPAAGRASLALPRMLPAGIGPAVAELVKKAKKSDSPARKHGLELQGSSLTLEVIPFRMPLSGERYFIVLFDEERGHAKAISARKAAPSDSAALRRLKTELASTRGYLQTIAEEHEAANEELKAANEEIISSNEELQSTNEELEIAKEELQAANEELTTVNDELHARNADLGQLNNDLTNLLSSVHLAIVMVSSDMRIRRFTPMAETLMNLIPGDVGRPIGDIKLKIDLPAIEEVLHEVVETVTTRELEVRDADGRSYSLRVRPYKTTENKIDGAVIVLVDNDPIRRSLKQLGEVSAFESVLDMSRAPLAVLDERLCVRTASRSMYQAFGLSAGNLGRPIWELGEGRWNVPGLRGPLERLAGQGTPFDGLRVEVGGRPLEFSGRRVKGADGGPPLILLSIEQRP